MEKDICVRPDEKKKKRNSVIKRVFSFRSKNSLGKHLTFNKSAREEGTARPFFIQTFSLNVYTTAALGKSTYRHARVSQSTWKKRGEIMS